MSVNHKISYFDSIQFNIIANKKQKIYSYSIDRPGSSFLKFSFANIKLPPDSYVEFQYGGNAIQRDFFHNTDKADIIIPDERVNIRVVSTKILNSDDDFSFELSSVEYDGDSKAIIGQDERRPYMCFYGTEIAEHALASAAARIGGWGSCSLIGNENHVLTNQHVVASDPGLTHGEIWFNWFNQSCDPSSPVNEPVRLKPGHILTIGPSGGSDNDYALLTLDEFDYVNSNVKALFGGLELSKENPYPGENIYMPQYGNNGLRPMYISDMKNGEYARILAIENNGNKITYNADTQSGSSGSPVVSRESNQLVGLHWGGANVNVGVSAQKLNAELGSFISNSNESVIGLGNVNSFNLELTAFNLMDYLIPIELDKKGAIIPFDTVLINDYDHYSLIEVEAIDLITDEIFPLTFKASLVGKDYQTNINDNGITGNTSLKIYDFNIDNYYRLLKSWLAFKINEPIGNIKNYVIRMVLDYHNPYKIPFDVESATVLDLKLRKKNEIKKSSVYYTIEGKDNYGFVAVYNGQGPVSLVWAENGYSEVKVLLRHPSGDEVLVILRGMRQTACITRTMNSASVCASSNQYSKLILEFNPEDNKNLLFHDTGIYEGIIPLQASQWNTTNSENILINVSLQDETYHSGPEELLPIWLPDSVKYFVGDYVEYNVRTYICTQEHISNSGNTPGVATTLWQLVS